MEDPRREELAAIAREMKARLSWYRQEGIDAWNISPAPTIKVDEGTQRMPDQNRPKPYEPAEQSLLAAETPSALFPIASEATPARTLSEVRDEIGDCRRCKLCSTRKNIVFGTGNPHAALMFVGEAPGADEDAQGQPFVGRAGQLLTKMIEAMGLSRETVYIANIIKCRPPENRNPQPDEIAACSPFLLKQIEAIRPKVICALGTFSAQTLLETQQKISALRGKFHDYHGVKLLPTFHPAYLLRNPNEKKTVWEDLKKIMEELKNETFIVDCGMRNAD
ncbi:MAG: uracil-DNA glycosylase [Candidatus Manganitrophus sp.]|nr:MAG: uracil-DNA glycosylase [Candidatus Manganitrophus sp.]